MTVQCVACRNFSLRGSELARQGFGNCAKKPHHEYPSAVYPRQCQQFVQADADQEAARRSWLDERGTK